jgi:hypothetical protein
VSPFCATITQGRLLSLQMLATAMPKFPLLAVTMPFEAPELGSSRPTKYWFTFAPYTLYLIPFKIAFVAPLNLNDPVF